MASQLGAIRALIIDMDGVLWRGSQVLPGVAEFFAFLNHNSIRFLLSTNNATRTAESVVEQMKRIGVDIKSEQGLTSANATARWLRHKLAPGARVLVIGEKALSQELAREGFDPVDPTDPLRSGERTAAVVVGLDRRFTYDKLYRAMVEIRLGAEFIATNGDVTFPAEHGLAPGAGALVAAVRAASQTEPTTIGKPHQPMYETALELLGTPREQTAMLGDRLDTDIEGGEAAGLPTILVMTGVTTEGELRASRIKPTFVFPDLIALVEQWERELSAIEQ